LGTAGSISTRMSPFSRSERPMAFNSCSVLFSFSSKAFALVTLGFDFRSAIANGLKARGARAFLICTGGALPSRTPAFLAGSFTVPSGADPGGGTGPAGGILYVSDGRRFVVEVVLAPGLKLGETGGVALVTGGAERCGSAVEFADEGGLIADGVTRVDGRAGEFGCGGETRRWGGVPVGVGVTCESAVTPNIEIDAANAKR
jgi:hypothetical protein